MYTLLIFDTFHFSVLIQFALYINMPNYAMTEISKNKCARIESYEVEIPVEITEPVTVTYTKFCLKNINLRCKKQKTEYRKRNITKTDVRHKIVEECCPGYEQVNEECIKDDPCQTGECVTTVTTDINEKLTKLPITTTLFSIDHFNHTDSTLIEQNYSKTSSDLFDIIKTIEPEIIKTEEPDIMKPKQPVTINPEPDIIKLEERDILKTKETEIIKLEEPFKIGTEETDMKMPKKIVISKNKNEKNNIDSKEPDISSEEPDIIKPEEPDIIKPEESDIIKPEEPDIITPEEPDKIAKNNIDSNINLTSTLTQSTEYNTEVIDYYLNLDKKQIEIYASAEQNNIFMCQWAIITSTMFVLVIIIVSLFWVTKKIKQRKTLNIKKKHKIILRNI